MNEFVKYKKKYIFRQIFGISLVFYVFVYTLAGLNMHVIFTSLNSLRRVKELQFLTSISAFEFQDRIRELKAIKDKLNSIKIFLRE